MNIGVVKDISFNMIVGIIMNDNETITYYSPYEKVQKIFETIVREDKNLEYMYTRNDDIVEDIYNYFDNMYIHAFSYKLPLPYYVYKVVYEDIKIDENNNNIAMNIFEREVQLYEEESK